MTSAVRWLNGDSPSKQFVNLENSWKIQIQIIKNLENLIADKMDCQFKKGSKKV